MRTFVFIDMQNIYLGVKSQGWLMDWDKFLIYLMNRYQPEEVFLFLGYVKKNQRFYDKLEEWGYNLIFKDVFVDKNGNVKANVDAELVLEAVDRILDYDKGILVSGDGDFSCLLKYWKKREKELLVMPPSAKRCSFLLRRYSEGNIVFLSDLQLRSHYDFSMYKVKGPQD